MMRSGQIIILLCATLGLQAQSDFRVVNHYAIKDGLSNSSIYCMRKDSRGFLWLGTKEGLNRFDGYQFRTFFAEKGNPSSLAHNKIFDILEYQRGMLLLATASGLSVFNTLTREFENEIIQLPELVAGSGTLVSSMFKDPEGNIWVNHSGELDVFDEHLNYLYRFTDLDWARQLKGVLIYYEDWNMDQSGRLWLPTDTSGLQIINFDAHTILNRNNNPENLPYLKYPYIRSFLLDEVQQTLWLGPWGDGLIKYDLSSGDIRQELFGIQQRDERRCVNAIIKTGHESYMFTIAEGCYEVNSRSMQFSHINKPQSFAREVDATEMHSVAILKSSDTDYWIGASEGLYRLTASGMQKELILLPPEESSQCVDLLISRNGHLYSIYSNHLLVEADQKTNRIYHYPVPIKSGQFLTKICEDSNNHLWVGSSHGIQVFDLNTKKFIASTIIPPALSASFINTLFTDRDGYIWIATRDPFGLYRYHQESGETTKIENTILSHYGLLGENARISKIAEDADGCLWMTSLLGGGILRFRKSEDKWDIFPINKRNSNILSKKGIVSIVPDTSGVVWVSTVVGDGLVRYDYIHDSITQFTREDGLLSDYVQLICPDTSNHLWITSEYGITQFHTIAQRAISNFPLGNWSPPGEYYPIVFDKSSAEVIVGLNDRSVFISTDSTASPYVPPVPLVDGIFVNNVEQFIDPLQTSLTLDYTQKNIVIDFTAVSYANAQKLHFSYLLSGADDQWKEADGNRKAQYAVLVPGTYIFRLRVAGENGIWGDGFDVLHFTIVPPFWSSRWFLLCATAVIILIIGFIVWRRIRTIRYEADLRQKIADTEMMALRAQMNPHFIFNCINSIDALIQSNDKYLATVYLNKFAKLIRNVLDSSKQNIVTLSKDVETLRLYIELEQFRNENKFRTEIHADPTLLQDDYKVPPLIIQPYVENAILHGLQNRTDNEGLLSISLNRLNGQIQYIIQDNGVGRSEASDGEPSEKRSYGMQMSSDRVKLFNHQEEASVEITDLMEGGMPAGTRVNVLLNMV